MLAHRRLMKEMVLRHQLLGHMASGKRRPCVENEARRWCGWRKMHGEEATAKYMKFEAKFSALSISSREEAENMAGAPWRLASSRGRRHVRGPGGSRLGRENLEALAA